MSDDRDLHAETAESLTSYDRDPRLGAAIEALPVPPRDAAFMTDLLTRLEEADAARVAQRPPTTHPSLRSRRRWLLATAAVTAAAVLAVMLLGPGRDVLRRGSGGSVVGPLIGPESAAAQIIRSTLAATGAARTLQGEMLAGIYRGGVFRVGQRISFIVSQNGSVDLRAYTVSGVPTGSLASWPDTRSEHIVHDAGARRETTLLHFTKTMTGIVERNGHSRTVHFTDQGFVVSGFGAGAPYDGTIDELLPLFRLRAYLRQVLDSGAPVVSDVTVAGRPAWRIVTTMAVGQGPQAPVAEAVSIVIDKRTRLPLRFTWHAAGEPLTEFRLTALQVDAPQPAGAFAIRFPKGAYVQDYKPGNVSYLGPDQHPIPFGDAAAMRRLMQSVDIEPAFPSWLPAGFVRSAATYGSSGSMERIGAGTWHMTQDTVVLSLAYRRGFDAISVSLRPTGSGHGTETVNGKTYVYHGEDPFLALYGPAYRYIAAHTRKVVLRSGPFAGQVAHIVVDPSVMPHLWVADALFTATVSGDLSSADMVRVVESLKAWPQPK
jgi:hypothetical protein